MVAEEEAKAKIFLLKKEQRSSLMGNSRLARRMHQTAAAGSCRLGRIAHRPPESNLGGSISTLPTYQLRQVLASLIASATISMRTGKVEITLRIPQAAVFDAKTGIETLSLRQTSPSSTESQAQSAYPSSSREDRLPVLPTNSRSHGPNHAAGGIDCVVEAIFLHLPGIPVRGSDRPYVAATRRHRSDLQEASIHQFASDAHENCRRI